MSCSKFKIPVLLLTLLLWACQSQRTYTSKPSKSIINPDSDLLEVNAVAYHINDSVTTVYNEIVNENLIYKRPDTTFAFYAEVRVSYKLLPEQNSRKIIDSGSYYLKDRAVEKVDVKSITSAFNVKAKYGNFYYLDIQVFDLNKRTVYSKGLNIYKINNISAQNYITRSNNKICFKNNFLEWDNVEVETNNKKQEEIHVSCFFRDFTQALPPFSTKSPDEFKYKPDSNFVVKPIDGKFILTMPVKGFYQVSHNKSEITGLTLYTYDKTFPGVSNSEEMINCTRYIMSKDEFEECKNAADKKAAIDKFWVSLGGSNERAKELLKRYYGRVKEANKYYTSYTQGWKTDRGMIFIVFGQPTNIYKRKTSEVWVYGQETNPNALHLVFNKTENPFSDNDFILERSQFFKEPWYTAVDYWRQGRVYLNEK